MKEKNLYQVIEKAKKEMVLFGYSKSSINEYNIIFAELLNYFNNSDITTFDYNISYEYFIKKFNIENSNSINNKYQLKRFRACKILDDIYNNREIERQYSYKSKFVINTNYYNNIFNLFLQYIENIGLSKNIIRGLKRIITNFLIYLENNNLYEFKKIEFSTLISFINTFPNNRKSKNLYLYYLRTFLNYLYAQNIISKNLAILVPNMKIVKNDSVPSIWDFEDIKSLLDSIDKTSRKGIRNYAIILLALTTGMRGCDIINLKINDIDFNNNTIYFVQEKTKKGIKLPLLSTTKQAIATYLLNGRQKSNYNNVFLTINPIPKPIKNVSALTSMIKEYIKEINLSTNQKRGIHSFRHTILNCLFNDTETPLTTITEISGHSKSESLNSYIKTDICRLKEFTLNLIDYGGNYE